MPLIAEYYKHTLNFRFDAETSRGVLKNKDSFFIKIYQSDLNSVFGLGEVAPLEGLSIDFDIEPKVIEVVKLINQQILNNETLDSFLVELKEFPSLIFGLETAFLDLKNGGKRQIFKNDFFEKQSKIKINGLVWMGDSVFMQKQIDEKIQEGFDTIKLKIGAIDFDIELELIRKIRSKYKPSQIAIRLDANGAFEANEALEKIKILSDYDIHSIEQPIKQGQTDIMAEICQKSIIPIALDEELIINSFQKKTLLNQIKPQYIIIKPSLMGGICGTKDWITAAEHLNISWWLTSALESNIGLNAICQLAFEYQNDLPQGLGTGKLYHNNINSPLTINNGYIHYNKQKKWDLTAFN